MNVSMKKMMMIKRKYDMKQQELNDNKSIYSL
jgi:hypothetical protein